MIHPLGAILLVNYLIVRYNCCKFSHTCSNFGRSFDSFFFLFSVAENLATSLSLLGNHMFPERNDNITVDTDERADALLSVVATEEQSLYAEPRSDQVIGQDTVYSVSTQLSDRGPEGEATDNDQGDSGEFVVTMLAKAKLEEQGIGVKGRSSPLLEAGIKESPAFMSHRDEDVTGDSWRQHRKHVFVLSEAGKPIYSRYGSEEALSSTMGVMMALVSFVQSGDNIIRSVYSGKNVIVIVSLFSIHLLLSHFQCHFIFT